MIDHRSMTVVSVDLRITLHSDDRSAGELPHAAFNPDDLLTGALSLGRELYFLNHDVRGGLLIGNQAISKIQVQLSLGSEIGNMVDISSDWSETQKKDVEAQLVQQ